VEAPERQSGGGFRGLAAPYDLSLRRIPKGGG
jgi:hypothetical protein